jgi:hypothetical protein
VNQRIGHGRSRLAMMNVCEKPAVAERNLVSRDGAAVEAQLQAQLHAQLMANFLACSM